MKLLNFGLIFIFFLCQNILAASIEFTYPTSGETITITSGSTINITAEWDFDYPVNASSYWITLRTEKGNFSPLLGDNQTVNNVSPGVKNWEVELFYIVNLVTHSVKDNISFNVVLGNYTIYADNNFIAQNGTRGQIVVDGTTRTAQYSISKNVGLTTTIQAITPQTDNQGYSRIWHTGPVNTSNWIRHKDGQDVYSTSIQISTPQMSIAEHTARYEANLRKQCRINFVNNFGGAGNGGILKVNGLQYNSPANNFGVVELNSISGEALFQVKDGIEFTFDHWSDGSTNANRTFTPGSNTTYTAYFIGRPSTANRNLVANTTQTGQPIRLTWNEHINPEVSQCQIWRKVRHNGVTSSPVLLATVPSYTTTYTDYNYHITSGVVDLVYYDVKYYYSFEGTVSNDNYLVVFGEEFTKEAAAIENISIKEYKLDNYPNPFNPSTRIDYQLPQDGIVDIKVFNAIGKQIAELVNEYKPAGKYSTEFNGSNLGSGIYICQFRVNNQIFNKKLLLIK